MQLARVSAKQPEQVPEKKHAGRKREKEQIRHLRRQPGRIIRRSFPNQPVRNAPNEFEIFHLGRSLLCRAQISIKLSRSRETLASDSAAACGLFAGRVV